MPQRQLLRDHAAHERAEHVGAGDAERVEKLRGIVGEISSRERATRVLAFADTAVIVGDGAMLRGELRHLQRLPAARRTAEPDDQQQRRAVCVAVDLVVELVGREARLGHARSLSRRVGCATGGPKREPAASS